MVEKNFSQTFRPVEAVKDMANNSEWKETEKHQIKFNQKVNPALFIEKI